MGVRGIRLDKEKEDRVVAMEALEGPNGTLLTVTENGFGKRTSIEEYRVQGRGGKGIINIKVTERVGKVVGTLLVAETDEVMLVGSRGNIIRTGVKDVRVIGRSTQGVKLIQLASGERVVAIARLAEHD